MHKYRVGQKVKILPKPSGRPSRWAGEITFIIERVPSERVPTWYHKDAPWYKVDLLVTSPRGRTVQLKVCEKLLLPIDDGLDKFLKEAIRNPTKHKEPVDA